MVKKTDIYANHLRTYFYSGWAFLIPYLAVYLLYYVTKWPVNPTQSSEHLAASSQHGAIPCMLHVYWFLHTLHVIGASYALWSWWKQRETATECTELRHKEHGEQDVDAQKPAPHLPPTSYQLLVRIAPWALLALIFYIPGVYLEWPSDPWEHLRRINEWRILDTVGAHSYWTKSAYFIPYSLLSWCIGLRQLFWLDYYYTGICLLLCWQYYRFSRACGLGDRASMVFVIIQALLFGNNIFSFYRYYGISSSIYAQLGAIALTRIILERAAKGTSLESSDEARLCVDGELRGLRQAARPEQSEGVEEREPTGRDDNKGTEEAAAGTQTCCSRSVSDPIRAKPCYLWLKKLRSLLAPLSPVQTIQRSENLTTDCTDKQGPQTPSPTHHLSPQIAPPLAPSFWHLPSALRLLTIALCLLPLIAFNHPQGIAIAVIGTGSLIGWRLCRGSRKAALWSILGLVAACGIAILSYDGDPLIQRARASSWLGSISGYKVFSPNSPAQARMIEILGGFGLVNVIFSVFLCVGGSPLGWLSLSPVVVALPVIGYPLAEVVERHGGPTDIAMFQRMFLLIPVLLSTIAIIDQLNIKWHGFISKRLQTTVLFCIITVTMVGIVAVPIQTPYFNRFWHVIGSTPRDLTLHELLRVAERIGTSARADSLVAPPVATAVNYALHIAPYGPSGNRLIGDNQTDDMTNALSFCGMLENDNLTAKKPKVYSFNDRESSSSIESKASGWILVGGYLPELASSQNPEIARARFPARNPIGHASYILNPTLYPISSNNTYVVSMTVSQLGTPDAGNYLCVAWYDENRHLLEANQARPLGAGNPSGWTNGTYSYFGLTNTPAPSEPKKFQCEFGVGTNRRMPTGARYARYGALLNYTNSPTAISTVHDGELIQIATPAIRLLAPSITSIYSAGSLAGLMSNHWPSREVDVKSGGLRELERAINPKHQGKEPASGQ